MEEILTDSQIEAELVTQVESDDDFSADIDINDIDEQPSDVTADNVDQNIVDQRSVSVSKCFGPKGPFQNL